MKNILVTGGAGYIGSVCVELLAAEGYNVVVIDNLQEGYRQAVSPEAVFYKGDCGDRKLVSAILSRHKIQAVLHFAGETTILSSMKDPAIFFRNNLVNGIDLLDAMLTNGCKNMIFSSTAAVFGNPDTVPIRETHATRPINSYGESKLMFEKTLDWYHRCYGLKFNTFRYFNAAGATEHRGEAHRNESHLVPILMRCAMGRARTVKIFGDDYPTKDGTCVRDYIHVMDLARAHILSLHNLDKHPDATYNLGNGSGFSNLEIVRMVEAVSGRKVKFDFAPRRAGDPAILVADPAKARRELGWKPRFGHLKEIVASAWEWHRKHPRGYRTSRSY